MRHATLLYGIVAATAFALAACGGGSGGSASGGGYSSGSMPATTPATGTSYAATNLVADVGTADSPYQSSNGDLHLVNGWGVAFNPQGFVWVADNGTSTSTLYDGNGVPQSLVVAIPAGHAGSARPTGIAFNGKQSFNVTRNGVSAASVFIFAGAAGTVSGWTPGVDPGNAITAVDNAAAGAVYTGLALASQGAADRLYAADFHGAKVDVFDSNFTSVNVAGAFVDPALPPGYAPFGIQALGGLIYVAYARQDASASAQVAGAGLGTVDTFDTAGNLVQRLIPAGGPLNAPWGIAMAPSNFGQFSNALLVANAGDGRINAFNPTSGALLGTLSTATGGPIAIDGLHGIAFGNGLNAQPSNTLFYAAGPGGGTHGVYGRIDLQ
ncbi:TIGR03118 family protein [Caenimonas terrae]|uniref:TIGR03118 family protein n=1 Tax=Caenimonas terrae TaxID=696074 RepID=A0ABW0NHN0_9BURK